MNENIRVFLEKLDKDESVQAKMKAASSPEEAYALASSVQGGFTKEEFIAVMEKLMSAAKQGELSDEDVAAAAGGTGTSEVIITIYVNNTNMTVSQASV